MDDRAAPYLVHSSDWPKPLSGGLKSGGGGGTFDGMEARVAKLEASVGHVERDVGEIRADTRDLRDRMARLEERVSHLPGKGFIVGVTTTALALMVAASIAIPKVQALLTGMPKP